MRHKTFSQMNCPIARGLEHVGDWWNMLILREALVGKTRFEQFSEVLGIPASTLTRRLDMLVEGGLLVRSQYSDRPPRDEYLLTETGREFRPVLLAMLEWSNRNYPPTGARFDIVDVETGAVVEPVVVDRRTGEQIPDKRIKLVATPDSDEHVRARFEARPAL